MIASSTESPSVNGTNRKWYIAVRANCRRDRSTTVGSIMDGPGCVHAGGRHQMAEHGGCARLHAVPGTEKQEINETQAKRFQHERGRNLAPVLCPAIGCARRAGRNAHHLSTVAPGCCRPAGSQ